MGSSECGPATAIHDTNASYTNVNNNLQSCMIHEYKVTLKSCDRFFLIIDLSANATLETMAILQTNTALMRCQATYKNID